MSSNGTPQEAIALNGQIAVAPGQDEIIIKVAMNPRFAYTTAKGNKVLASTHGNVQIPGTQIKLGLNMYVPVGSGE